MLVASTARQTCTYVFNSVADPVAVGRGGVVRLTCYLYFSIMYTVAC